MSRKQKWKGIPLNKNNIDEYMNDLYNDTKGQYITQGVSFNKDDNFQMNLLKNALLAHGSFSGFVKFLMHSYFEKNDRLDDSIWMPNPTLDNGSKPNNTVQPPTQEHKQEPIVNQDNENKNGVEEQDKPVSPTPVPPTQQTEGIQEQQEQTPVNNQRQRPKMRNNVSLSKALLEQKPE